MDRAGFVWDLPIRITHWLFATCVIVSWWSAEQRYMDVHRWSGYLLLALLVFRVYWGFAGSASARFATFVRGPRTLVARLRQAGTDPGTAGHTPWGGWSVITMLSLMTLQVGLGLFVTDVDGLESGPLSHWVSFATGRALAEAHEAVFNVLLGFIVLHLVALAWYFVRGENLLRRMLPGARGSQPHAGAAAWRVWPGIALAVLVVWVLTRG